MMYPDDIQKVNDWFDEHTEFYGTYREDDEYSLAANDIKDFTDFLQSEFPDLINIECCIGTGDSKIWFFKEDLEKAEFL